jgi:2-furoate---CoA ligase
MLDLGSTLAAAAARNPRATALVDGGVRLTYGELFARAAALAAGLSTLGLSRGDRLLSVLQNRHEAAILHWATQLAAVVIVPVNWRAKADEIDFYLKDSEARAIVYEEVSAPAVAGVTLGKALPRVAVGGAGGASHSFESLFLSAPEGAAARAQPTDWSLMFYTSGTTGRGKGVPRRHHAERAAALAHVAQNIYRTGEITLGVMPLYHTMGVRSLLAMALINGTFVCLPRFEAGRALALIARERITTLYLVPTLYHDLLQHPDFARIDISSVRKLGFAGAAMTEGLLKRLDAAFKPDIFVNHYGSSEIYTFTIDQHAPRKPGSAGRAGINTEVRVVRIGAGDPDDVVAPGVEGEIIASRKGDEAFEGYWKRPDANERALRGDWYFTGDVGYADADGDIFVTGRVDDMLITGGENVLPVEIESLLSLHPAVDDVAVAGVADDRWGHRITAFIRRNRPVSADELDAYCRTSDLANFKRPKAYVFVEAIPKSPVGKILRRLLVAGEYRPETSPPVAGTRVETAK